MFLEVFPCQVLPCHVISVFVLWNAFSSMIFVLHLLSKSSTRSRISVVGFFQEECLEKDSLFPVCCHDHQRTHHLRTCSGRAAQDIPDLEALLKRK